MIRKIWLLALVLCADAVVCLGRYEGHYSLPQIDYRASLSHSAVLSVFQDRSGLMWFGTYDGLNCYDGNEMTVFRSGDSNTLSNNVIHSVNQADDNCLWLTTYLNLDRFSMDTFRTEKVYDFVGPFSVHSNSRGDTFLVNRDSLYYYNRSAGKFCGLGVKFTNPNSDTGKRLFVAESGELWYFPEDSQRARIYSVSSFDQDSSSVRLSVSPYDFHTKYVEEIFYQNGTMCFVDRDKDLYMYDLGQRSKVYIRNIADLKKDYGKIEGIVSFYNDIFIGFIANGLVKLCASDRYAVEDADRNIRVYCLYKDNEQGILWVGTDGRGAVSYAHQTSVATSLMFNQISSNLSRQVRSLMTDDNGDLWFGTKGDGIVRVKSYADAVEEGGPVKAEIILPDARFNAMEYVRKNQEFQVFSLVGSRFRDGFWAGTGATGLFWYSYSKDSLSRVKAGSGSVPSEIHSIFEESDSVLYVATADNGFHKLLVSEDSAGDIVMESRKTYSFYSGGREINMFFPLLAQGDSLLWLGSRESGLVRFDRRTEEYQVISLSGMLHRPADDILSMCLSKDGGLYVGTASGLVDVDFSGGQMSFSYVGREQGLPNDMIHGVIEDSKGFLWLSTNKGLVKYNPANGSLHSFYYTAGVSVGEFCDDAYYKAPSGEIFFGGVGGLLWLNNDADFSPAISRDVVLRGLEVDGRQVNLADCSRQRKGRREIVLGGGTPLSFSIMYGVPDFVAGRDIEYSYLLEGFDKEWSLFNGNTRASFTSVPAGKYVFRLKYKKDIFDVDYRTFEIPVLVVPKWYWSVPAKIFYLSVLAAVLLIFLMLLRRKSFAKDRGCRTERGDSGLVDRLAVIYQCCDRLRVEDVSYGERLHTVGLIRDTMSGILYGSDDSVAQKTMFPSEYFVTGMEKISDVVREVVAAMAFEGADVSSVTVSVPDRIAFPVYRNAFRRIVHLCLRELVSMNGAEIEIIADRESGKYLRLLFLSSDADMDKLRMKVSAMFGRMMKDTGIGVSGIDDDDVHSLEFLFPPVVESADKPDPSKGRIVFLGASSDLTWLISDMLAPSYHLQTVESAEEAFRAVKHTSAALLMVNMQWFEGREREFLNELYKHKSLVAHTSFLPMFTADTDRSVCRELILVSDAYMMLPYDIMMLKNVVHKAIYGKGDISHVSVEDLGGLVGKMFCVNDEETEFARKLLSVIDGNLDRNDLGTVLLADRMAMSSSRLYRKTKKIFGVPPEALIKNYRMEKAARLLRDDRLSITDVIADVGIQSRSYFYKEFANRFGMTPKDYKDKFCSNSSQ